MPRAFECRLCRHRTPQLIPRAQPCPGCNRYTNQHPVHVDDMPGAEIAPPIDGQIISLQDAVHGAIDVRRIETGIAGFDQTLAQHPDAPGGGLVPGACYLLCGSPGSGKTTLLTQVFYELAKRRHDVLYISGEESTNQIGLRARRLLPDGKKFPARFQFVAETDLDMILDHLDSTKPTVFAIDSIQMVDVGNDLKPGSGASIEAIVKELTKYAHQEIATAILIGHITKDGYLSGPKKLEHAVDCVLEFIAPPRQTQRVLQCPSKNRFGNTPRQARFEMRSEGLVDLGPFELGAP